MEDIHIDRKSQAADDYQESYAESYHDVTMKILKVVGRDAQSGIVECGYRMEDGKVQRFQGIHYSGKRNKQEYDPDAFDYNSNQKNRLQNRPDSNIGLAGKRLLDIERLTR